MKNTPLMIISLLFILLNLISSTGIAQDTPILAIERIFSAPALQGTTPSQVKLSPDGQRVTFIRAKETDNSRFDLWEYNIKDKQSRLLFNADDLH